MKFNEWAICIKESRDWYVSKYWSIDYYLIKRYDDNDDDNDDDDDLINKTKAMNLLQCLYDKLMRILLILWILI